ncbi:hypothetical protein [Streptomyces canus]|uniref:hypothetical protein n=1 Tax=Streptomyces canus TaxID=58343 RepID=UPI002E2F5DCA|nr:hypothetical protein [Streptomyces canus]
MGYLASDEVDVFPLLRFEVVTDDYGQERPDAPVAQHRSPVLTLVEPEKPGRTTQH